MIGQLLLMVQAGLTLGDTVLQPAGTETPFSSWFGNDVAFDPPIAVVANRRTMAGGTAYVYSVGADGSVSFLEEVESSTPIPGNGFGTAVELDNGWLAVGKGGTAIGGLQGSVELFEWVGGQFVWRQELSGPTVQFPFVNDEFGGHLALSGDTLVVGATRGRGLAQDLAGYVEIFKLVGSVWVLTDHLVAPDGQVDDVFGWTLAIDGDSVFVAAPFADSGAGPYDGAVYWFQEDGGGVQQYRQRIDPANPSGSFFGLDLGILGEFLVVGEPLNTVGFTGALHTLDFHSMPAQLAGTWRPEAPRGIGDRFSCDGRHMLAGTTAGGTDVYWLEIDPDGKLSLLATLPPIVSSLGLGPSGFGWDVAFKFPIAIYGAPFYWDPPGFGPHFGAFSTVLLGQKPVELGDAQPQPCLPAPVLTSTYIIPQLPATLACAFPTTGGLGALLIGRNTGAMTSIGCLRLWPSPFSSLVIPIALSPTQSRWDVSLAFPKSLMGLDLVAQAVRFVPGTPGGCVLESSGALSIRF